MIGGVFLIALIAVIAISERSCQYAGDQERIAGVIAKSQNLQFLDKLCTDLPKPDDLKLLSRSLGGNSYTSSISQLYEGEASFAEFRSLTREWAGRNEWEIKNLEDTSEFLSIGLKKGNLTISVSNVGRNYVCGCSKVN